MCVSIDVYVFVFGVSSRLLSGQPDRVVVKKAATVAVRLMTTTQACSRLRLCAVCFVYRVESAITSGSLPQLASQLRQELATLAAQDYSASALMQLKKQGLIIDMMHSCNVVEGLLAPCREDGSSSNSSGLGGGAGVPTSPKDWAWTRQLKYYASAVRYSSLVWREQQQDTVAVACLRLCLSIMLICTLMIVVLLSTALSDTLVASIHTNRTAKCLCPWPRPT